ncbi:hypothetical protein ACOSQ3_004880 [Xanthoceras sorbifolium]
MEGIYANQSTSILDDIVSQVLGKEDHGQVRGLGSGITPTRVNASVASKQTTTRLRSEMNILKQQLQDLQSFVFNIQSLNKALSSHMDGSNGKGKKCKLLNWIGNGEVVDEAEVNCTDPHATVHHMSLGPDCWRVCVKKIW